MNNLDLETIKTITEVVIAVIGGCATYVYRKATIHKHKQDELDNAKNDKAAKERANKQAELDEQKARKEFDDNMNTALEVGKNKVVPLAVNDALGTSDKRQLAVQQTDAGLKKLGIDLPEQVVGEVTERAYQLYKANGGDVHKLDVDNSDNQPADQQTVKVEATNNQENNGNQAQPNNPYVKGDVNNG